jgi:hypothetical protein
MQQALRIFTLALVVGLALGTMGAPAFAAEWTDHSGTICKNYNAGDVGYIDYLTNGTRITRAASTSVICPLTRNTTGTNGAYFYVYVSTTTATSCTAYSYDYNGNFLASASNSGTGLLGLNLSGAGKSTALSNYSVLCYLPGNYSAVLNTVDIYEY